MKLVSYNIRFGLGTDHRINLERIAETVCDADIIGLQEVERFWKRGGMLDQPDILGGYLKEFYWAYCPAFDMDASERNEDGTVLNRRRQFGPMVLSRWPILASRLIVFPKLGTVKHFNMDTGGIECVIDTPSGPLRVYSIHLSAISPRDRLLQIDYLLAWHRQTQSNGGAWTGSGPIDTMDGYEGFIGFD
jgi:endonuclease/exonuclease/phosphatase family metal-dependent hydrolase